MKNKIVLGASGVLLVLTCIVSLLTVLNHGSDLYSPTREGGYDELIIDCSLPEIPEKIPHLKIVHCAITSEEVKLAAEGIFGFTGNVDKISEEEGGHFGIWDAPQLFRVYSVGAVEYWNRELSRGTLVQPDLPSYEQAKAIAENIMGKIDARGLTPQNPNMQITFEGICPGEITILVKENVRKEITQYLNVGFTLKFKEFKIGGPGAKVSVGVGENNEIVYFRGIWKEVEEDGYISIRVTPEQAIERLKSGNLIPVEGLRSRKAIVKGIELGYYSRALSEEQDHLLPIYLFQTAPILENGSEGEIYYEVVPATDELLS